MFKGDLGYALTAGMVATVNPCGFALLPAYLGTFVGLRERPSRFGAVPRALAVSAVLTAGFVTVFGLIGIVFGGILDEAQDYAPWLTIVTGVVLVVLGVYLLSGRDLTLNLPKLERGGADGTLLSMYLFGLSYAIASLSCGIGAFLIVTSSAQNAGNYGSRVATFVAYGVGMGLIVAVLTVAVALAKVGVVARFREFLPYVNRFAGGLMVITGAYVAYYGWYEIRIFHLDGSIDDPVVDAAQRLQSRVQSWMPNVGNYGWYVAGALLLIGAALVWSLRPSRRVTDGARHLL